MYNVKLFVMLWLGFFALVLPLCAEEGMASWYGGKFHGRKTSSGEVFDTYKFTAAHRTLPFGTVVKVINLDNEKSTVVRITDRGPFVHGRVIDLSKAAAEQLDMMKTGVAHVRIEVLSRSGESGFYRVQIASYKDREHAQKTKSLLVEKGLTVYFEYTAAGYVRVCVDNISLSSLEKIKNTLHALGFNNYLVKKIN